ncbi:MAG TPA: excinuclease ABC subunit UvrC [Bacteroidia bacterium]|nr:excinuclease ABC subunit UvrC [Bacteroidia bacterium]
MKETIKQIVSTLPDTPGVYQYFDKHDKIIYIGKAKSLKKRVSSYFTGEQSNYGKTAMLVKNIADIRFIVVETEHDALLLENSLIKKHQPRYNVMLKDDKTYPWICIKKERFPRVFSTRRFIRDGSTYFGPYASGRMVNTLLELVGQLYKLRNCNLVLSEENIEKKKFRVCLEYHVGNCKGPCEGFQSEEDYNDSIRQIKEILKGNINTVIAFLTSLMKEHATALRYEEAQQVKEKLQVLENYKSKSVVVNASIHNVEVFSIVDKPGMAYVNFLKVMNGAIVQVHTVELKKKLDESPEELLAIAINEIRTRFNSNAAEVLVNVIPELTLPGVNFIIPKIGDKKHLLNLSEKNLMYYIREQESRIEKLDPTIKTTRILTQMKTDLRMIDLPVRIECFDNSNIQGAFPVSAMSVFIDARPAKSEYRHYNVKTVEGPDDFATMREVISRRYGRLKEEGGEMPQLIVIDGGKGQLSAAVTALKELDLYGKVTVIGIAKKLEEIYYPNDSVPLYLDKKGETLKVLQHIRDEVHRFGITHHRKRRTKALTGTELGEIPGVGEATTTALLRKFKSVKKVKEASAEELEEAVGKDKALRIYSFYHP